MRGPFLFLLLLLASAVCACRGHEGAHALSLLPGSVSDACDIHCWLAALVIELPNQAIDVPLVKGTLTHLTCGNMSYTTVVSSFPSNDSIQLTLEGLALTCEGDWTLHLLDADADTTDAHAAEAFPGIDEHGTLLVSVSGSSGTIAVDLVGGPNGMPAGAELTRCHLDVHVSAIQVTGSKLAEDIIKVLKKEIEKVIDSEVDKEACVMVKTMVNTNLTAAIQSINHILEPFIVPPSPDPAPPIPHGCLTLESDEVVGLLDFVLDTVLGGNGAEGLNDVIDGVTNGTGAVYISDLDVSVTTAVPDVGIISAGIAWVKVEHLDSWTTLDALQPVSRYDVSTVASIANVSVHLGAWVNLTFVNVSSEVLDHSYLYQEMDLAVAFSPLALNASAQLCIDRTLLRELQPLQLLQRSCAASLVKQLNYTELDLDMQLKQLAVTAIGGSDPGTDAAISDVITLIVRGYGAVIPDIVTGIGAGPGRSMANTWLEKQFWTPRNCTPEPKGPGVPSYSFMATTLTFGGGVLLCFVLLIMFWAWTRNRDDGDASDGLVGHDAHYRRFGLDGYDETDDVAPEPMHAHVYGAVKPVVVATGALVSNENIPLAVRLGVPAFIILNAALIVSAETAMVGSVYLMATVDGVETWIPVTRIPSSQVVNVLWSGGSHVLAVFTGLSAGLVPLMWMPFLFFSWILPVASTRGLRWRTRLFRISDLGGKWVFGSVYSLSILLAAFRYHITLPTEISASSSAASSSSAADAMATGAMFPVTEAASMMLGRMFDAGATLSGFGDDAFFGSSGMSSSSSSSGTPGYAQPLAVDTLATGQWGYFALALAAAIGLIISRVASMANALACEPLLKLESDEDDVGRPINEVVEARGQCVASRAFVHRGHVVQCTMLTRVVISLCLVAGLALTLAGIFLPCIVYHFTGAAALVLEYVGQPVVKEYNYITLWQELPKTAVNNGHTIGFYAISIFAWITGVGTTVVFIVCSIVLWLAPARRSTQQRIMLALEWLRSFVTIEVFAVYGIPTALQTNPYGQHILAPYCDPLQKVLETYFSAVLDGDTQCLEITGTLGLGQWLLLAGCCLTIIGTSLVMVVARRVVRPELLPDGSQSLPLEAKASKGVWVREAAVLDFTSDYSLLSADS